MPDDVIRNADVPPRDLEARLLLDESRHAIQHADQHDHVQEQQRDTRFPLVQGQAETDRQHHQSDWQRKRQH